MYWPIGAPRIYAACNSKAARGNIFHVDDADESRETTKDSGSSLNTDNSNLDAVHDDQNFFPEPPTPSIPGVTSVDQDAHKHLSRNLSGLGGQLDEVITQSEKEHIFAVKISRTGHLFAVVTATSLTIWQTKPTAILAVVVRSASSLRTYGPNVSLLIRSDSAIFVVQTTNGYLITYSLAFDPDARVYRPHFSDSANIHTRRQSHFTGAQKQRDRILWGPGEGGGIRDVSIRFRMVIKVDAGIGKALALDEELVVATEKPAAVQCIRWTPDSVGNQTSTELLSRMGWLPKRASVLDMIHDRPMNLSAWVTTDGKAYAVQRVGELKELTKTSNGIRGADDVDKTKAAEGPQKLFRGYCFHCPKNPGQFATVAAINARFSLISVGCIDGSIHVYTARDYAGNVPLSHIQRPSVSSSSSGKLTFLSYSPDGYCLFAGYEQGWAMWSVFGKPGSTSFAANRNISDANDEGWLNGVRDGAWLSGGTEILLIGRGDNRIWVLEMARSAVTGCFTAANISRTMLQARSSVMVYRGHDLPDLNTISADPSLWHTVQIPSSYLVNQWPIRCSVISPDGRYVAVAGRRGLAHYSINSSRWKVFDDEAMENEFQVRGGMCWHQHLLVAAVEAGEAFEIRLYSREAALDKALILHIERVPAPIVLVSPAGQDSLLVYTYDNLLYHYIFVTTSGTVNLVQVGQIALHGIVRSPARVRGLSWILPDKQLQEGDPSHDVAVAAVLFLVDGKLVLLQPSLTEEQTLKYDMRMIAQNIEYYAFTRELALATYPQVNSNATLQPVGETRNDDNVGAYALRDSLWMFDGNEMKVWTDVQDVLRSGPMDLGRELPLPVAVPVDFYPLSVLISKGILLGVESDLVQRRDISFAFFRFATRTHLFVPELLKFYIARYDPSAALHLAQQYQHLEYFAHALEILLHKVLDEEVDSSPPPESALLSGVLSFLSSFPQYLDIVVQCTRKTEVRSWRTLFTYLPPPAELFEESLQSGSLKTAGGYLLILHTFEELSSSSDQLVRLLARAKNEGDLELCKELARFLAALDETGDALKETLQMVDLRSPFDPKAGSSLFDGSRREVPGAESNGISNTTDGAIYGYRRRSSIGSRSPTIFPTGKGKDSEDRFSHDI